MARWLKPQQGVKHLSELSFWRSRSRWLKTKFEAQRWLYHARENVVDWRRDVGILQALVRSTFAPFLFSLIILAALVILPSKHIQDSYIESYDNVLIAVASITGIFLSLYFTSLNTVIGGLYARSPKPVRELIIQERVNHFSVRFLVFLTLLCLELLAAGLLFENRLVSTVYAIVPLGCFGVLFFAELGKRAFYFFDPSLFAHQLQSEILKWAVSSTSKGYQFNNPSFQDYYRRKAEAAISGLQGLVGLAQTESHLRETLAELTTVIQRTYVRYLRIKRTIPTSSKWFLRSPAFQDWYTASELLVRMASVTQTDLRPEDRPNREWLELRLENLEEQALSHALENGNWEATLVIFGNIFNQFTALGNLGEISQAFSFLGRVQSVLAQATSEPIRTPVAWESQVLKYQLAAIQLANSLVVTLTAGLFNSLEQLDLDELKLALAKHNWDKASAPYDLGLPSRILERAEYLHARLDFEKRSEGKLVTPSWYLIELVFEELAFFLREVSEAISLKGLAFFDERVKVYENEKRFVEAGIVASDALEMESKTRHFVTVARRLAGALDQEHSIHGLAWPEWSWDKLDETLVGFHERMVVAQVSHLGPLFTWTRPSDLPDYFGKGVILAGEECIKSLRANKPSLFAKLFPKYLGGILLTFDKFRLSNQGLRPEQFLLLLAEPIMDLLDVSGYSLLYSEFHQNPALWKPCEVAWETTSKTDGKEALERLALVVKAKKQSVWTMTNRDRSRSQWAIDFGSDLSALPKKYATPRRGALAFGSSVIDHPSRLIRVIGGNEDFHLLLHPPDEIFIDLFLQKLPAAAGLDFGLRNPVSASLANGSSG